MTSANIERKYANLARALQDNGGAECEQLPEMFFPEDASDPESRRLEVRIAKAICKRCPLIEPCLIYAMTAKEPYGVWGGTTAEERQVGRRQKARRTY
jgi:WhiB family redox-sensing transcriptional regulator